MKILACIKEATVIPGPAVFMPGGTDINPDFKLRRISEADEQAVEEAVRLTESRDSGEAVAVTVGEESETKALRHCLAIGASRAIRTWNDELSLFDPLAIAAALAQVARDETPDIVLCGVQSTDFAQQITGPALAAYLGWPFTTTAVAIEIEPNDQEATVTRDVGAGAREIVRIPFPAVITVQLGINRPRTPSFKQVFDAKKAPIQQSTFEVPPTHSILATNMRRNELSKTQLEILEGEPGNVASTIKSLIEEN